MKLVIINLKKGTILPSILHTNLSNVPQAHRAPRGAEGEGERELDAGHRARVAGHRAQRLLGRLRDMTK